MCLFRSIADVLAFLDDSLSTPRPSSSSVPRVGGTAPLHVHELVGSPSPSSCIAVGSDAARHGVRVSASYLAEARAAADEAETTTESAGEADVEAEAEIEVEAEAEIEVEAAEEACDDGDDESEEMALIDSKARGRRTDQHRRRRPPALRGAGRSHSSLSSNATRGGGNGNGSCGGGPSHPASVAIFPSLLDVGTLPGAAGAAGADLATPGDTDMADAEARRLVTFANTIALLTGNAGGGRGPWLDVACGRSNFAAATASLQVL